MKALNPSARGPIKTNRCTAHRKNGEQCRNAAILGATVCRVHGGSAPQVKRAAQVRLAMATEALVQRLLRMADDEDVPPAVRLAAIRDALDRANVVGTQEIAVTATVKPWEETFRARIKRVYNIPDADDDNVVDAEVVEDRPDMDRTLDVSVRDAQRDAERAARAPKHKRPRAPRPAGEPAPRRAPEPETPDWSADPPTRMSDAEWSEQGRARARRSSTPSGKRKPGQKRV